MSTDMSASRHQSAAYSFLGEQNECPKSRCPCKQLGDNPERAQCSPFSYRSAQDVPVHLLRSFDSPHHCRSEVTIRSNALHHDHHRGREPDRSQRAGLLPSKIEIEQRQQHGSRRDERPETASRPGLSRRSQLYAQGLRVRIARPIGIDHAGFIKSSAYPETDGKNK